MSWEALRNGPAKGREETDLRGYPGGELRADAGRRVPRDDVSDSIQCPLDVATRIGCVCFDVELEAVGVGNA
jgi:hypothetical protein